LGKVENIYPKKKEEGGIRCWFALTGNEDEKQEIMRSRFIPFIGKTAIIKDGEDANRAPSTYKETSS